MKRALLALALLLPLVAFGLWPIAHLVWRGAADLGASAWALLGSDPVRRSLWGTVLTSSGAALLAFTLGLPLAVLLERTDLPGRRALTAVFTLPSAIPPFIQGMGWVALANPRAGLLNRWLGGSWFDIYGSGGIALVLGIAGLPLVLLSASAVLKRVDSALEEAARLSGAGALRTLSSVPGRLALPAALSGASLVFLFAASAFGVPYLLGVTATPPTPTLTTRIYTEVLMGPRGLSTGAVMSALLLVLASAVQLLSRWLGRAGRVRLLAGKGARLTALALGPWRTPLGVAAWLLALTLVALPLGAVFLTSVSTSGQLQHPTLAHWSSVLGQARTLEAAGRSLLLSLGAAALVTALGLAVALVRTQARGSGWLEALASWPYAVPGTVLALGLLVTFSMDLRFVLVDRVAFVLALSNTVWLVLLAWTVKHLAFGVRNAAEGLAQVDPSLTEAARVSGARPLRAFVDATVPQLSAALTAAFTLTFLTCATELTLAVLLVPTGQDVLGTLLFELQSYADPASAAVIACTFVLVVLAALALQAVARPRQEAR